MVSVPSPFAVVVVLACLATTHSAPLRDNAYMTVPNVIPLNAENPAFGGRPSTKMATVVAPREIILSRADVEAGLTLASNTTTTRHLEVSSSPDLDKLEAYFGRGSIERNFQALKAYGSKQIQPSPWPSSYWPVYEDSINAKWDGPTSQPASEKYARAFGVNVQSFMNTISSHNGIDSNNGARACTDHSQCTSLNDGSKCAIRVGQTRGYCTPTWWGICHAWAPAAILEAEPSCPVVLNGVTFKALDIKALVSLFYDGAGLGTMFMGARENGKDDSRDEYGRFTNAARRDLGPGFFHIAVSNIMGKFGRSFVADIDPGYKVWNQPIRAFKVVSTERMTPDAAAQRFFHVAKYPFNGNARSIAYVEMDFTWINELVEDGPLVANGRVDATTETRRHKYVLELDSTDNILGGEWVAESQTNHPDFMWFATDKPSPGTTTGVGLSYANIKKLMDASAIGQCPTTAPSGGRCGSEANGALTCPTGEYCQPWNPSEYYCRKLDPKCGKQEAGMDYWGNDLKSVPGLLLPEQCCDQCHATEGCTSYTFINYVTWGDKKPLCFLKSGTPSDKRANPKAVSAMIERGASSCSNELWDRCGSASAGVQCCQAGTYCQPWDLLNYQCMPVPQKCGTLLTAVDFYGNDLSVVYGLTTDECCDKCAATTGCKAFTYVNDNTAGDGTPACYLKSGSGDRRSNPHVVSGLVN